jgi:hypothetical protein
MPDAALQVGGRSDTRRQFPLFRRMDELTVGSTFYGLIGLGIEVSPNAVSGT